MPPHHYPLLLQPVYKDYIWGGNRLIAMMPWRDLKPGIYAESWEIADRPEGESTITNGPLKGQGLNQVLSEMKEELVGFDRQLDHFPLLVKIIDAKENLSLQVHPDTEAAARLGAEPKTELWYVLAADPGACVYAGLNEGVTKEQLQSALEEKKLIQYVKKIAVKAGDLISIPAGRPHAIGAGCMMLEVQQNSNTTYRLFDWDRLGNDGLPRDLHIKEGLESIHWNDTEDAKIHFDLPTDMEKKKLFSNDFFALEKHIFKNSLQWHLDGSSFKILFCLKGQISVSCEGIGVTLLPGRCCLLPAGCAAVGIFPEGIAAAISISLP